MCLSTLVVSYFFLIRRHPWFMLFPYTTLFRSLLEEVLASKTRIAWYGDRLIFASDTPGPGAALTDRASANLWSIARDRSEEHTSELQSRGHLVCRLLLEKKKCVARK